MTDERLHQILQQALTPEIRDSEIQIRNPEKAREDRIMKKITKKGAWKKTIAAACACAALIAAIVCAGSQPFSSMFKDKSIGNLAEDVKNTFTLSARAEAAGTKTLERGKEIPVFTFTDDESNHSSSWSGCTPDDTNEKVHRETHEIAYCHDISLICEGKNIDAITYSINTGYFLVPQPDGADSTHNTSYTIAADNQTEETTAFSVAGKSVISDSDYHLLFGYNTKESIDDRQAHINRTLLEKTSVKNKVLNDIIITATIRYKDGDTQEAKIQLGTACKTYEELGIAEPGAENADKLVSVTTYKLL